MPHAAEPAMRTPRFLTAASLVLAAAGCGRESPTAPSPITQLPRALTTAEQQLIARDNAFAFRLFGEIAHRSGPGENLFVSPLSFAMALGMTYNGAAGATADEMAATLGLTGLTLQEVNESYRGLIVLLRGLDRTVDFRIANSIWYRLGESFEQDFLDVNHTYYDAEVRELDFGAPGAARTINDWVSDATNGRIPDILEDPLPRDAVMFLINAIYFKGSWTYTFPREHTSDGPFLRADGSSATVPMMRQPEEIVVRAHTDQAVTVLDLPYGGGAFAMTIAMPHDPSGLAVLVDSLTEERWSAWIAALDSTSVQVFMPKFTVRYDLEAKEELAALGMPGAFCGGSPPADFTRLSRAGDLCISRVKHQAFVEVNEEGTEAAAATVVQMDGTSSGPPLIVVDRPFFYVIRERISGTILFIGRMMDPSATTAG